MQDLQVFSYEGQPRVSSRDLAVALDNQHGSVMRLINDHQALFEEFGVIGFEIEKPCEGSLGGRPTQTAYLNEDQCYFLLTLVRNSELVVKLKLTLVQAFAKARAKGQHIEPSPLALAETMLHALKEQDARLQALESWKDTAPINSAQIAVIHHLGQRLGHLIGFASAWNLFKRHFNLASYRDLPSAKFEEAKRFLELQIASYTQGVLL